MIDSLKRYKRKWVGSEVNNYVVEIFEVFIIKLDREKISLNVGEGDIIMWMKKIWIVI